MRRVHSERRDRTFVVRHAVHMVARWDSSAIAIKVAKELNAAIRIRVATTLVAIRVKRAAVMLTPTVAATTHAAIRVKRVAVTPTLTAAVMTVAAALAMVAVASTVVQIVLTETAPVDATVGVAAATVARLVVDVAADSANALRDAWPAAFVRTAADIPSRTTSPLVLRADRLPIRIIQSADRATSCVIIRPRLGRISRSTTISEIKKNA